MVKALFLGLVLAAIKPGDSFPDLSSAGLGGAPLPSLAGKVVLVDFWGISCGPCAAELPEVQAAAAHFAGRAKELVMIGLHESGATVGEVAEFARKRGLTYRLAIDRPAGEDGWFGATFKDYGVRAIPAAAVIDREGKIAFVGRFPEALREAAKLLEPSPGGHYRTRRLMPSVKRPTLKLMRRPSRRSVALRYDRS